MPSPPDPAALLPATTPPLVAAALRSVASIRRFERTQRLERLDRYFDQRRPPANYLVGCVIVDRFTSLLFGDGSFPEIRVEGDADTEDFCAPRRRPRSSPSA